MSGRFSRSAARSWLVLRTVLKTRRVRLRGLEPPRGCPHRHLKPARLPIPPQPRRGRTAPAPKIAHVSAPARPRRAGGALLPWAPFAPLSSRGLGRRPLTAETGVRIPVAVLGKRLPAGGAFVVDGLSGRPAQDDARARPAARLPSRTRRWEPCRPPVPWRRLRSGSGTKRGRWNRGACCSATQGPPRRPRGCPRAPGARGGAGCPRAHRPARGRRGVWSPHAGGASRRRGHASAPRGVRGGPPGPARPPPPPRPPASSARGSFASASAGQAPA
jgi:hypothetical protein